MSTPTWSIVKLVENIEMLRNRTKHKLVGKEEYRQYILLPFLASMGYEPSNMNEVVLYSKLGQLDVIIHDDFYMTVSMDSVRIPTNTDGKAKIHLGVSLSTQEYKFYLLALGKWELIYHFKLLEDDLASTTIQNNYLGMMRYMVKESILEEYNVKGERIFTEGALDKLLSTKDFNNRFLHYILEKEIKNPSHDLLLLFVSRFKEYFTTEDSEQLYAQLEPLGQSGILGIVDTVLSSESSSSEPQKETPLPTQFDAEVPSSYENEEESNSRDEIDTDLGIDKPFYEEDNSLDYSESDIAEYVDITNENTSPSNASMIDLLAEMSEGEGSNEFEFSDDLAMEDDYNFMGETAIDSSNQEDEPQEMEEEYSTIIPTEADNNTDEDIQVDLAEMFEDSSEKEKVKSNLTTDADTEINVEDLFQSENFIEETENPKTVADTSPVVDLGQLFNNVEETVSPNLHTKSETKPQKQIKDTAKTKVKSDESEFKSDSMIIPTIKVDKVKTDYTIPTFEAVKVEPKKSNPVANNKTTAKPSKAEKVGISPKTNAKGTIQSVKVEPIAVNDYTMKKKEDGGVEIELPNIMTTKDVSKNLEYREKNKDIDISSMINTPPPKKRIRKLDTDTTTVGVKDRMAEMRERMREKENNEQ